jgi:uncharacterized OB-fold protein
VSDTGVARMPRPARVPPLLTELNEFFWKSGGQGELRFLRCRSCRTWIHPPAPVCRTCLSRDLLDEAVSGKATVLAYTVNHQQWNPDASPDPYVIAIVAIAEQDTVRLTTNIVNCEIGQVEIGMAVRVVFEPLADVWLPLFEPDG